MTKLWYCTQAAATKSSFMKDDFFCTGDQAKQGEDDYLIITGRIKELITKGSEKISSIKLGNTVAHNPHIADMVSFTIPDDHYGEDTGAAVGLKKQGSVSEDDLKKLLKFKIADKIRIVPEIPKTRGGLNFHCAT